MSEFELLEALASNGEMLTTASMNCVAIFFAYVVAAYLVGAKLPKQVAVFLSIIYSLFIAAPASAVVQDMIRMIRLAERYIAEYPNSNLWSVPPLEVATFFAIAPIILGWLGSLYYMHGIERRENAV